MPLLPELLAARAKVDSPESFGLLMMTLLITLLFAGIKNEVFRPRGATVDSGRGLPQDRVALSGVPLTLTCQGIELRGVMLDNEPGAWAIAHLPSSLDAQKYSFKGSSFLFARFGDEALAEEVRSMAHSQSPREGDVTLAYMRDWDAKGRPPIVELRIWGSADRLASRGKRVLVGRLNYASMLALRKVKGANWLSNSGSVGELTITYGG